jgi:formate hydrogenlyase subunit 6/NADH:ubiquinone oxidoreductase subunit I
MKALAKALLNLLTKPITIHYPKKLVLPPRGLRGEVVYDRDTCMGCGFCVRDCPTNAIKPVRRKVKINLARCIFCGICELVCPVNAIELIEKFELAAYDKRELRI